MILYNRNTFSKFGAVRYTVCADLAVQHVHTACTDGTLQYVLYTHTAHTHDTVQ